MAKAKKGVAKRGGEKKPGELKPDFRDATGTGNSHLQMRMLNDAIRLLRVPEGLSEKEKDDRIVSAIAALNSIGPTDVLEGMLAAQMLGTHSAAMDCLANAGSQEQSIMGRDMYMKHATKLLSLYTQQMAALDKHRGKGQQKVTVEHVHVASGGQAFVGTVEGGEMGGGRGGSELSGPVQIEGNLDSPFEVEAEKKKRVPRRGK
jgi:hypothetical protein